MFCAHPLVPVTLKLDFYGTYSTHVSMNHTYSILYKLKGSPSECGQRETPGAAQGEKGDTYKYFPTYV